MKNKIQFYNLIFSTTFFSVFLSYFFSSPAVGQSPKQSWVISESLKDALGPIPPANLISALNTLDIAAEIASYDDYLKGYQLLKGRYFTVYLAPVFNHDHQVWILSHPGVRVPFEELTVAHLQELDTFRYWVGEWYRQQIGYEGYAAFMDPKKDYGLGRKTVCLEMIPAFLKGPQQDIVDWDEKLKRYTYFFYSKYCTHQIEPQKIKEKIQNFILFLSQAIKDKTIERRQTIAKNTLPWREKVTPVQGGRDLCLKNLEKNLVERHALLHSKHDTRPSLNTQKSALNQKDGEFTGQDNRVIELKSCAFCNPVILKKQGIYNDNQFLCLHNYAPLTPTGYHLMVIPQAHVEDWQTLSLEDSTQLYAFTQIVVKAMQQETQSDDIILLFQNRLAGGMSVPHIHMHALIRPSALYFNAAVFTELTGHGLKPLTHDQMLPRSKKIAERIRLLRPSHE